MIASFPIAQVREILEHSKASKKHKAPYGMGKGEPGLWLVGDQGIYLMSNGDPGFLRPGGGAVIVYAEESNPDKMEFDEWYGNKREIFGGDDGVEFLPLAMIERALSKPKAKFIKVNITPKSISIK
jgi:hypothetical protein